VNGRSFVHGVNIVDVKSSEAQLEDIFYYRNPYPSIQPHSARLTDANEDGEDHPISVSSPSNTHVRFSVQTASLRRHRGI